MGLTRQSVVGEHRLRERVDRFAHECGKSGGFDDDFIAATKVVAQEDFGHGRSADVADADNQDAVDHGAGV
jgi:hypothetical protein